MSVTPRKEMFGSVLAQEFSQFALRLLIIKTKTCLFWAAKLDSRTVLGKQVGVCARATAAQSSRVPVRCKRCFACIWCYKIII